jgi:NADH-quinone oxidoreductase subunit J
MQALIFFVFGALTLAGAFGVILARNPVHSALSLVVTLVSVAVLFIQQDAHLLAAVQVVVYAGAIVVLFLFVIMLLGVDRSENLAREPLKGQRPIALVAGVAVVASIFVLARTAWVSGATAVAGPADGPGSNVEKLADALFTRYLLMFEMTSVLLVIAVVGAVVLARHSPSGGVRGAEEGPTA